MAGGRGSRLPTGGAALTVRWVFERLLLRLTAHLELQLLTLMIDVRFAAGELTESELAVVAEGFQRHSDQQRAPAFNKERMKWLAVDEVEALQGVLTADILWDWMYVDELWVAQDLRGTGLGKRLMRLGEQYAATRNLQGIWLWTQSWQAGEFYRHLGYEEFTRFEDFPKGHARIGFRKHLD